MSFVIPGILINMLALGKACRLSAKFRLIPLPYLELCTSLS